MSQTPTPLPTPKHHDSVWIGPFEQLLGAIYSFSQSKELGISKSTRVKYFSRVQQKISLILASKSKNHLLEEWLSHYFFYSGIERLVWTAERLIVTMISSNCEAACSDWSGNLMGNIYWNNKKTLERVKQCIEHLESKHINSGKISELWAGVQPCVEHQLFDKGTEAAARLQIFKVVVNVRKHRVTEKPSPKKGDTLADKVNEWELKEWEEKIEDAEQVLKLVDSSYRELFSWNPNANHDAAVQTYNLVESESFKEQATD